MTLTYKARLRLFNKPGSNLLAYGDVSVNSEFVLKKIAVMQKKDGSGIFVSYPSKKNEKTNEYEQFYHPITKEGREALNESVLETYRSLLEQQPA